jgi:ABC-type hemin transport system substrate-binding protein
VVILPDEPYRFARRHLESLRKLERTEAWRASRIHFVDGKMISWYGPRTPVALARIASLLKG